MKIRCCPDCADTIDLFRITDAGGDRGSADLVIPFLEAMRDCPCPAMTDLRRWIQLPEPGSLRPIIVTWTEGRKSKSAHGRPAPPLPNRPKQPLRLSLKDQGEPPAFPAIGPSR